MSRVRVECETCGKRWLDARRVILTVGPGGSTYRFECVCGARHVTACSPRIACLLAEIVVTERIEPEAHDGPPINGLDVMEAVLAMREPGWERELA